jgi:hypothetical protein
VGDVTLTGAGGDAGGDVVGEAGGVTDDGGTGAVSTCPTFCASRAFCTLLRLAFCRLLCTISSMCSSKY